MTKKSERQTKPTNKELLEDQPQIKKEDEAGKKDHARQVKLDLERKNNAKAKLVAHDLSAQNGPRGAQPNDPKPPYWELKKEDGKDVEPSEDLLEQALVLVKQDADKQFEEVVGPEKQKGTTVKGKPQK